MKKRIVSTLLALALCLTLLPTAAFAEESGGRQYYDGTNVVTLPADTTVTTVNSNTTTWTDGWYFVPQHKGGSEETYYFTSVKMNDKVTVNGDVKLILEQHSILELPHGLEVKEGATLTIYRDAQSSGQGMLCDSYNEETGYGTVMTIEGKGTVQAMGGDMEYTKIGMGMTYKNAKGETYAVTDGNLELDFSGDVSMETGSVVKVSANGTVQTGAQNYKYQGDGSSGFLLENKGMGVIVQIDKKDGRVKVNDGAYYATLLATLKAGKDEAKFTMRTVTSDGSGSGFMLQSADTGSSVTIVDDQIYAMVNTYGVVRMDDGKNQQLTVTQGESAYTVKLEKAGKISYSANFLNTDGTRNEDWTVTTYTTVVDGTEFSLDSAGEMTLTRGGYVQRELNAGESCTSAASGKEIKNNSTSGSEKVTVETYADGYDIAWLGCGNGDGKMTIGDKQFASQESSRVAWAVYPDGTMKLVTGYTELAAGESVTLFDSGNVYKNVNESGTVNVIVPDDYAYEQASASGCIAVSVNGKTYTNYEFYDKSLALRYYTTKQAAKAGVSAGLALVQGQLELPKDGSITLLLLADDELDSDAIAALPLTNTADAEMTVLANPATSIGHSQIYIYENGSAKVGKATITGVTFPEGGATELNGWLLKGNMFYFFVHKGMSVTVNGVKYTSQADNSYLIIDADGSVITMISGTFTTDQTGGYTLSGTVIEAGSNSAVYGALVKLQDGSGKPVKVPGAMTDANGKYEIKNVPAGYYNVIITYGQSNEDSDEMSTVEYLPIFIDYTNQTHNLYNRINVAFDVKEGLPFKVIESGTLTTMAQYNMSEDAPDPNNASDYTLTVESNDKTVLTKGTDATGKTTLNFKTTLTSGLTGDTHYTNAENFATLICLPMDDVNPKNLRVFAKATRYDGEEIEAFELAEFSQSNNTGNKIFDWDEDCKILQITCDGYKQVEYTVMYDKPADTKPSSSSGSSSNTTGTTVKNPDGSTTTTTTDKKTGEVTETTQNPDGTIGTTVTDKDGNVTDVSASVPASAAKDGATVTLPIDEVKPAEKSEDAQEIKIDVPAGGATIEIPVENPTPGTVVVIVDEDGNETIVPGSKVTENGVEVTLTEGATIKVIDNSKTFSDVKESDYFSKAVQWAAARNITGGIGGNRFGAHESCTRAQLVTFLWRAAGQPEAGSESGMSDVSQNTYYTEAVAWAFENGIVGGYGNGLFGSDDVITREQVAVILYRFAQFAGMDTTQGGMLVREYEDYESISDFAVSAMQWAVNAGIMQGNNGKLMPQGECDRAQIVTMLYRLLGE